jgi:nucleoside-diphosphate-sugar epimerase
LVRSNVELTIDAVRSAQSYRARTFVYLSSVSVNGDVETEVNPNSPIINPGVYGISKYLGEMAVKSAPFRTMSIRMCGVIGRGAHRNWLSRVLRAAKDGSEIEVCSPYSAFNNAVHVSDLCAFVKAVIVNPDWSGHQTVTTGAAGISTPLAVVSQVVERTGRRAGIRLVNPSKKSFVVNNDLAVKFGYRPGNITEIVNRYVEESLA